MENYRAVIVNYNDQFDDCCNYIGGDERLSYVLENDISLRKLRENISYILSAEDITGDYMIYCLSKTRSERMLRSIISTDMNLVRLLSLDTNRDPTVYLVHNHNNVNVADTQSEPSNVHVANTQPKSSTYYAGGSHFPLKN